MDDLDIKKNLAKLEALLFIYGEPIEVKKAVKNLGIAESDFEKVLGQLETKLQEEGRGLTLIKDSGRIQLATKPEMSDLLSNVIKQEFTEDLTPAALETLSIIAYAAPITRADLEYIRGVNSSFILRALLMRGLIERSISPQRANAYIYSVSFDLLRQLGISSADNLPDYKKYRDLVNLLHQETIKEEKGEIPSQNADAFLNSQENPERGILNN
ncbi:MAG: segregation and condensation protein B [Parcubacteria group bacterium Athens0714_26]|nr:MAG: segregation and condensation protein B [Parcubacteria group bacterium Athens1014_26]TSD03109.1 MAG: segregation and condensation protein B [Parcubacteria group bacterium Athens0714_26]